LFCELVPWLVDVDVEELGEELCGLLGDAELEDELLLFCELDCGVEVLLGDDVGVVDGGVELCELVGVEEDGDDEEDDEGGLELCELDDGVELELLLCELDDEEELLPCEPVLWLVCDEEGLDD